MSRKCPALWSRDCGRRCKYKATTNSNHSLPVAPNLLEQDLEAAGPNRKWVSDITYVSTDEGWLYVAVVLDLYSRLVAGLAMSERMTRLQRPADGPAATEDADRCHRPPRPW